VPTSYPMGGGAMGPQYGGGVPPSEYRGQDGGALMNHAAHSRPDPGMGGSWPREGATEIGGGARRDSTESQPQKQVSYR